MGKGCVESCGTLGCCRGCCALTANTAALVRAAGVDKRGETRRSRRRLWWGGEGWWAHPCKRASLADPGDVQERAEDLPRSAKQQLDAGADVSRRHAASERRSDASYHSPHCRGLLTRVIYATAKQL